MGNNTTSTKPIKQELISTLGEIKSRDKDFTVAFSKAFDTWLDELQTSTNVKLIRSTYFYSYIDSIYKEKFDQMDLSIDERKYLRKIMKKVWNLKIKKGIIEPVEDKPGSFTF